MIVSHCKNVELHWNCGNWTWSNKILCNIGMMFFNGTVYSNSQHFYDDSNRSYSNFIILIVI